MTPYPAARLFGEARIVATEAIPRIFKKNFKILNETINWKQENITFYGKTYPVPRKTAWYGYPWFNYTYSGIKCNPDSWTPELMQIKKDILLEYQNKKMDSSLN